MASASAQLRVLARLLAEVDEQAHQASPPGRRRPGGQILGDDAQHRHPQLPVESVDGLQGGPAHRLAR
jgi:hypothetical protein